MEKEKNSPHAGLTERQGQLTINNNKDEDDLTRKRCHRLMVDWLWEIVERYQVEQGIDIKQLLLFIYC